MFSGGSRHDKEMQQAVDYLEKWGKSFWLETEYRVREITTRLEQQLSDELKAHAGIDPLGSADLVSGEVQKLSLDQRAELCSRGQKIISAAQVQDLHNVIKLLDNVLSDRQKQYLILVDGLDENWVEEKLRYRLIMALVVTARDLIAVKNAKLIIALRRDLIERVFRLCRDAGFQEEKYQSLYLPLVWGKKQLLEILDRRIDALVSRRYTKQKVTHRDLLPKLFNKTPVAEYVLDRTQRPRDVIAFFNCCIAAADNLPRVGASQLRIAEGEYSRSRLRALADEWSADYPDLLDFLKCLQNHSGSFKAAAVSEKFVEEMCLEMCAENPGSQGSLRQHAMRVVDCVVSGESFRNFLLQVFYRIGLIGLKLQSYEATSWVDERGRSISAAEISGDTTVVIHPTYHRALGIKPV